MVAGLPSHSAEVAGMAAIFQLLPAVDDAEMRRPELQMLAFGTAAVRDCAVGYRYFHITDDICSKVIVNGKLPFVVQLMNN